MEDENAVRQRATSKDDQHPLLGDGDATTERRPGSLFYVIIGVANLIALIAFVLLVVWLVEYQGGFAWETGQVFNYHPLLMVLSMVIFYGNAVILFRGLPGIPKLLVKVLHATLHIIAFVLIVIGLQAVFKSKALANRPNMYSLHSWVGMGAVVLFACQLVFGFTGFLWPKFPEQARVCYLKVHVFFGVAILVLVLCSVLTGLLEKAMFTFSGSVKYSDLPPEAYIINFTGVLLSLFVGAVLYVLLDAKFKRLPEGARY